MRFLQWLLGGAALLAILYFVGLNAQRAPFYWAADVDPIDAPIYMIVIVTFVCGYLTGLFYHWLGTMPDYLKQKQYEKSLRRRIEELECEIEDLQE